jgi:hypothetical protein
MKKLLAIFTILFVFGLFIPQAVNAQKHRKSYASKRYKQNKNYRSNNRSRNYNRRYDNRRNQRYYNNGRRDRRSVYSRHRNLINIGIGTGAGAIVGGIIGGKKGALIGAGVGAGAGAAYTYGINPKKKRRSSRRYRRP